MIGLYQICSLFFVILANGIYVTIRVATRNRQPWPIILTIIVVLEIVGGFFEVFLTRFIDQTKELQTKLNFNQNWVVVGVVLAFHTFQGLGHLYADSFRRQCRPISRLFWIYHTIDQLLTFAISLVTCAYVYLGVNFVTNNPNILYIFLCCISSVFSIAMAFIQIFLSPILYYQPFITQILPLWG